MHVRKNYRLSINAGHRKIPARNLRNEYRCEIRDYHD